MKKYLQPAIALFCLFYTTACCAQVTFTNSSSQLQTITGTSGSDCAADMNGDQLDDVIRVLGGTIYIDFQLPGGGFDAQQFDIAGSNDPSWSICTADIDGNGFTDLLFGDGNAVSFIYASDDGTSYLEDPQGEYIFSQRSTFSDIDNDGNLDAFVCHDVDQCRPYRNTNGVLSCDSTRIQTLDVGGNYAAMWVDYDNDWDSDLYITKCRGGAPAGDPQRINLLYRNDGDGVFTSVGPETNMDDGDQSWTTCFEDWDNDGDFDSFTVNHEWANRLMENNGDGTFTDVIADSGIDAEDLGAWDCDAVDFDNDGFVDIFSEMNPEAYWNNGDWTFTAGQLPFTEGGVGDMNNDGFLDVIYGNTLWLNDGNENNWVRFDLEGIESNKDGIGARIEIYGPWGIQIREVRAGRSFSPGSSLISNFGIGDATGIDQVVVKWPSGTVTTIDNPVINTTHIIAEAGCSLPGVQVEVIGATEFCPGQSAELNAPAGNSYVWSNGATTQSITVANPGNYSVIVFDEDGCAALSNNVVISLIESAAPVVTLSGENVFCEGGSAILSSSIAATYLWSTGQTGQTIVVEESGTYWVSVSGACDGVDYESATTEIEVLSNPAPVSEDVTIGAPGTVTFTATGNNLQWYDTEVSTEVLGTGNSFETEFFTDEISYWITSSTTHGGELEEGGKPDNSGGGGLPQSGGRLFFNATEEFTLLTTTVYVSTDGVAGDRTIQLYDSNNILISETTGFCDIGTNILTLNFTIPAEDGLSIACAENNLFRNNAGLSYPYLIGTAGEIYSSSNGTGLYYYFYDWQIQKLMTECVSDRVEVIANVVGVEEQKEQMFAIYPNPTVEVLNVQLNNNITQNISLIVLDETGRKVMTSSFSGLSEKTLTLDVSQLAAGVYSLEISSGNAHSVQEFVKK